MKKFKKIFLCICSFVFIFVCFFTPKVKADYPSTMVGYIVREKGAYKLLAKGGMHLYAKGAKFSNGTVAKAFCGSFWYKAPDNVTCKLSKFGGSKPDNVSAGVGAIIYKARQLANSNGSLSWDIYFTAEVAINQFLYTYAGRNSVNKISIPSSISNSSSYKQMLSAGISAYNTYSMKNGGVNVYLSALNIPDIDASNLQEKYDVTATVSCKNTSGTVVNCSLSSIKGYINGKDYSNAIKSTKNGKGYNLKLTVNKSDLKATEVSTSSGGTTTTYSISAKFSITNNINFVMAAIYKCGSNLQSLIPNALSKSVKKPYTVEKSAKEEGKTTVTPATLTINKVDENNKPVVGAKLKVYSSDDCDVVEGTGALKEGEDISTSNSSCDIKYEQFDGKDYIITTGKPITVSNLTVGKTYVVVEEEAPDGYVKNGGMEIITLVEGNNVVTLENNKSYFKISKQDITSKKELMGAKLEIRDSRGITIQSWTSSDKPQEIEGLEDGNYTLVETIAPKGYTVSESINFTIENGKLKNDSDNMLVMYDKVVVEVEDTFTTQNVITMIAGLVLVIAGTGVLLYEIKRKKTA